MPWQAGSCCRMGTGGQEQCCAAPTRAKLISTVRRTCSLTLQQQTIGRDRGSLQLQQALVYPRGPATWPLPCSDWPARLVGGGVRLWAGARAEGAVPDEQLAGGSGTSGAGSQRGSSALGERGRWAQAAGRGSREDADGGSGAAGTCGRTAARLLAGRGVIDTIVAVHGGLPRGSCRNGLSRRA